MAKKRVTLYLESDLYDRVRELLERSPTDYPVSRLITELLADWYQVAKEAPNMKDMTPDERELAIYREAFKQQDVLLREVRETLLQARLGGDTT
jgi:hypothetical protein